MPYSVLVVDERPIVRARIAEGLRRGGYDVIVAPTFEVAKQRLAVRTPNLLIAASRLGFFNGMHLVVRSRIEHPAMAAILTAPSKDPLLEAEASIYGATCVPTPETSTELLALVSSTFASQPM